MKTNFTLSIPTPCKQDWENFSTTSKGGFCSNCSKEVINFVNESDEQIASYFQMHDRDLVCGRFRTNQLKSQYTTPIQPGLRLLKVGLLCLLLFLSIQQVSAQTVDVKSQTSQLKEVSANYSIKGIVKSSEDNSPLAGVNVYLKGTNTGTATDANGRFEFPKRLSEGDILVFSFIGIEKQELTITAKLPDMVEIMMNFESSIILGMVSMEEIYTPHKTDSKLIKRSKAKF